MLGGLGTIYLVALSLRSFAPVMLTCDAARFGRRCEDIVWLKTNRSHPQNDLTTKPTSLFTSSVEHCLMGIKGTVRRSTDSWIAHCNVDTDVIVWEGDALDRDLKPPELHALIEQFCNGTRRLHLYASPHSLRRGWLSLGTTFEPIVADSTSSPTSPPQTASTPIILPIEGERATWTPTPYDPHDYSTRFVHFDQTSSNSTHTRLLSRDDISRMMQSSSLIDRGMEDSMIEGRKRIEVILPFVEGSFLACTLSVRSSLTLAYPYSNRTRCAAAEITTTSEWITVFGRVGQRERSRIRRHAE